MVVPVGTVIYDIDTEETLGDLTQDGDRMLVAKGGRGGLGNQHFKTSTNRTPRKATPGTNGEKRELRLELKLIADVGLLGLPNAGKSTLISVVSSARPKIADYPFTTLHPNLGVVYVGEHQSFVMADIPGLIEGAADGAGLGIRFLKHLQRTRVLLHLIDIAPPDPDADPVVDARAIAGELKKFSPELAARERWLVLNKLDLLPAAEAEKRCKEIVRRLRWKGPVHRISAVTQQGTKELCQAIMRRLEALAPVPAMAEDDEAGRGLIVSANLIASAVTGDRSLDTTKKPARGRLFHWIAQRPRCERSGFCAFTSRGGAQGLDRAHSIRACAGQPCCRE